MDVMEVDGAWVSLLAFTVIGEAASSSGSVSPSSVTTSGSGWRSRRLAAQDPNEGSCRTSTLLRCRLVRRNVSRVSAEQSLMSVDIRIGSPGCGRWVAVPLNGKTRCAVFVAARLGHSFITLSDEATGALPVLHAVHPGLRARCTSA
jgi:hypothetical protein